MNAATLTSTAAFVAIAAASVLAAVASTDLESRFQGSIPEAGTVPVQLRTTPHGPYTGRTAQGAEARLGAATW